MRTRYQLGEYWVDVSDEAVAFFEKFPLDPQTAAAKSEKARAAMLAMLCEPAISVLRLPEALEKVAEERKITVEQVRALIRKGIAATLPKGKVMIVRDHNYQPIRVDGTDAERTSGTQVDRDRGQAITAGGTDTVTEKPHYPRRID